MVLRFDIAIAETTKMFPTAVLFLLDMCWVNIQTPRLVKLNLCCIYHVSMKQFYGRSANTLEMQHKLNLPKRLSVSSLKECRTKTKPRLDKSSLSLLLLCKITTAFRSFSVVNAHAAWLARLAWPARPAYPACSPVSQPASQPASQRTSKPGS